MTVSSHPSLLWLLLLLQQLLVGLVVISPVVLVHATATTTTTVVVTLDLNDHAPALSGGPVDDTFVSFTSDWWTGLPDWGPGSSILNVDLGHPKVVAAVTALTPAIWRIGGTRADAIWYHMQEFDPTSNGVVPIDGSTDPTSTADNTDNALTEPTTTVGSGGGDENTNNQTMIDTTGDTNVTMATLPPPPSVPNVTTDPVDDNNGSDGDLLNFTTPEANGTENDNSTTRFLQMENATPLAGATAPPPGTYPCNPGWCLTGTRWYNILQFAWKTGVQIVFTLNYSLHTQTDLTNKETRDGQEWDSTQARALLEFTKLHAPANGVVYGFELGNEVNHKNRITNFARVGRAYQELKNLIDEIWANVDPAQRPKLLGPAVTSSALDKLAPYVKPYVDVITFHKYQTRGGRDTSTLYTEALERNFYWPPGRYSVAVAAANGAERVWIGEGAMASDSGQAGITDTFLSSLWMANALGSMASAHPVPISTFCRQTLVGGNYGLLAPGTYDPYPDFYLMRLWTHIVGNLAIGPVGVSSTSGGGGGSEITNSLLVHAFCGKDNAQVIVILVNVDASTDFQVNIPWWGEQRDVYLLEGTTDVLSQRVKMNNVEQGMSDIGMLPSMDPETLVAVETLTVPSQSIAFAVVHNSTVAICGGTPRYEAPTGNVGGRQPNKANPYADDNLSTGALAVIIAAAALVFVLGCILCCCCGRNRRRRSPHSVLAQDDGLMMDINDDGLL